MQLRSLAPSPVEQLLDRSNAGGMGRSLEEIRTPSEAGCNLFIFSKILACERPVFNINVMKLIGFILHYYTTKKLQS